MSITCLIVFGAWQVKKGYGLPVLSIFASSYDFYHVLSIVLLSEEVLLLT